MERIDLKFDKWSWKQVQFFAESFSTLCWPIPIGKYWPDNDGSSDDNHMAIDLKLVAYIWNISC